MGRADELNRQRNRERKQRNRQYVRECKELGSCVVCGESRLPCLLYHHKPGTKKRFELNKSSSRSLETVYQEMQKCILVCANCHSVLHAEQRLSNAVKDEKLPLFE